MAKAVRKSWGSMGLPSLGLPSKAEDMIRITSLKQRARLKLDQTILSQNAQSTFQKDALVSMTSREKGTLAISSSNMEFNVHYKVSI